MRHILDLAFQREAFAAGRFVRVVNWHNTPESRRAHLRAELAAYLRDLDPLTPDDLDRLVDTGRWHRERPGFLPAFYDGYLDHATVAAPMCDELGIAAWFFPPTGFLDVPPDEQREYCRRHEIVLAEEEQPSPPWSMTWDHLAAIAQRHVVCAHTANHASAASIRTAADAEREVHEPVRRLTGLTGRVPPAFAFLYGTPPVPGTVAGDAVLASGVRYAATNTAYIRLPG